MRINISLALVVLFSGILITSCAKDTIDSELFGDIEGIVIDSDTEEGLRNVGITTTPPSNAILTSEDGSFTIDNVPTGSFTIQARKSGYSNTSVSVSVRDNSVATARILMTATDESGESSEDDLEAEVTSWENGSDAENNFVDVEYRISNNSSSADIAEYEVDFEIITSGDTFFFQVSGENLQSGQNSISDFQKNIREETATDVKVERIWIAN
ncbi:MAG: DUF2012 domain-containing protein [Balneolaceae bacterium]